MRNTILLFVLIISVLAANAQSVGINSDGSSPNSSAMLDVKSSTKGFLPPRVTLTGTTDVSTIASPATGLFVYNTATAGVSPSNVTAGLYYYDGSKWVRIINQQPDATIEFNQLTPTTASVVFTPNTPANKDYIYVSTVDNSQWTYNGNMYVTYTPPASTAWNLAGGTTDAGSNKTGAISRTGNVGVGPTTPPIYGGFTSMAISNATNGGVLDFLNGSNRVGTIYNLSNEFRIGSVGTTPNTIPLVFLAGGSGAERMRITGTGNVGIGTTTPARKLEVVDDVATSNGIIAGFLNPSLPTSGDNYIIIGKNTNNGQGAVMGYSKEATNGRAWIGMSGDWVSGGVGLTVAQGGKVGIGTASPNASAILDVTSTNKGFLPPRVALTGTTDGSTIASPATGLFVYNSATAGTSPNNVIPGFYYWDGDSWERIKNGIASGDTPDWTSAGAIAFGATTTAPSVGTTTRNDMSYRQLGPKEWEVAMSFDKVAGTGWSGSGDYLFTLPNGLSFDTNLPWQKIYTSNVGSSTEWFKYTIPMGFGFFTDGGSFSTSTQIVVYSATKFRIIYLVTGLTISPWGSNTFPIANNGAGSISFRFTSL